jgi:predicted GH43/DUF377 family glycosyl hydrolase
MKKQGIVPNVVFACSAVERGNNIFLYYGAADTVLAVAKFSLPKLLKLLDPLALRS